MRDKSLNIKTVYIHSLKKTEMQNNILKMSTEAFTGSHSYLGCQNVNKQTCMKVRQVKKNPKRLSQ